MYDADNAASGFDDFMNYQGGGRRERATYLEKPKKWPGGEVIVWFHVACSPLRIWRHGTPRLVSWAKEEGGEKVLQVWGSNDNCLESEEVLRNHYMRSRLTGKREYPPVACPDCIYLEIIRGAVNAGKLHWLAPVLKYEGDDETRVIRAAGLWNGYGNKKLNDAQKKEMHDARINLKEAWQENIQAKLNWVFVVVRDDKPQDGPQVAIVADSLGEKTRDVIRKEKLRNKKNPELGNPIKNPYAVLWTYDSSDRMAFDKKYDAARVDADLTPAIDHQIRETNPPDLAKFKYLPNLEEKRTSFEKASLVKGIDWDAVFGPALAHYEKLGLNPNGRPKGSDDQRGDGWGDEATTEPEAPKGRSQVQVPASPEPPVPDEDLFECDNFPEKCTNDRMLGTDKKCTVCGKVYVVEPEPPPPPPPAKKKRSELGAPQPPKREDFAAPSQRSASGPPTVPATPNAKARDLPPAPAADASDDWGLGDPDAGGDDGIPF